MKALFKKDNKADIGFEVLMQKEARRDNGETLSKLAFMGFVEVLFNLKTILATSRFAKTF
jgi:hypothetical protein